MTPDTLAWQAQHVGLGTPVRYNQGAGTSSINADTMPTAVGVLVPPRRPFASTEGLAPMARPRYYKRCDCGARMDWMSKRCRGCWDVYRQEKAERDTRIRVMGSFRVDADTGCWVWTKVIDTNGYGRGWAGPGKGWRLAHRVVWEMERGPIPAGLELDHLCRNRPCVNPDHLEPVTHTENIRRGEAPNMRGHRSGFCIRGHDQSIHGYDRPDRPGRQCKACRQMLRKREKASHAGS